MTKLFRRNVVVSFGALCLGLSFPAAADTIFDNSHNDLSYRFNPGTAEIGDQIQVTAGGFITDFSFEFWGTNSLSPNNAGFAGAVEGRVRFYYMDGAPDSTSGYATPGTVFFDSDWFSINSLTAPSARQTLEFTAGSDFPIGGLPLLSTNLTWTIQFQGMGPTDSLGVDIYSPATVGFDFPDYWQRGSSLTDWILLTNTIPMDFAATFQATVVPEPSVLALSACGIVALLTTGRWLRRRA